jgi:hypothetical protein
VTVLMKMTSAPSGIAMTRRVEEDAFYSSVAVALTRYQQ